MSILLKTLNLRVKWIISHFIFTKPFCWINSIDFKCIFLSLVNVNVFGLKIITDLVLSFPLHSYQGYVVPLALILYITSFNIDSRSVFTCLAVFRKVTLGIQIICFSDSRREFWYSWFFKLWNCIRGSFQERFTNCWVSKMPPTFSLGE